MASVTTSIKYVLCGGFPNSSPDRGKAYVTAATDGLRLPSVLFCAFAQPESDWEAKCREVEKLFSNWVDIKKPISLATPETFLDDLRTHSILYLAGGDTPTLYKALAHFSDDPEFWRKRFAGKVVVGSSAGVNVLTALSYNTDHQIIQHGLSLIERASLIHYRSQTYNAALDWDNVELELQKQTDLPILKLKEGEFAVLKQ